MIRLRIERPSAEELESINRYRSGELPREGERLKQVEGLVWFEDGLPVGRVVIEQEVEETLTSGPIVDKYGLVSHFIWVPVEVVDEI